MHDCGGTQISCVAEKILLDRLLQSLEWYIKTKEAGGGVILISVMDDDSLVYLTAALRMNSLYARFIDLVAGFSNVEAVFKHKKICKKMFSLKFLETYLIKHVSKGERFKDLEKCSSGILAEAGLISLNHILGQNVALIASLYSQPILSGMFALITNQNQSLSIIIAHFETSSNLGSSGKFE